jgi:hypothetical protein
MADTVSDRVAVLNREHDNRAWLAWHIVALSKPKRLPKLSKLLAPKKHEPKKPQSWQQQWAIMNQWAAATKPQRKSKP